MARNPSSVATKVARTEMITSRNLEKSFFSVVGDRRIVVSPKDRVLPVSLVVVENSLTFQKIVNLPRGSVPGKTQIAAATCSRLCLLGSNWPLHHQTRQSVLVPRP